MIDAHENDPIAAEILFAQIRRAKRSNSSKVVGVGFGLLRSAKAKRCSALDFVSRIRAEGARAKRKRPSLSAAKGYRPGYGGK
ncbi:hypothetical protein IV417_08810 [Alphaproteobacteria bacterium KMM 3653]|uniref:Uncharacterized protein n=1 Tax=Harenicola maris TaxID=2841044 RepID=A0AAP2CS19_9RHOB|nr:hypothetical protein [Harenicola maris]